MTVDEMKAEILALWNANNPVLAGATRCDMAISGISRLILHYDQRPLMVPIGEIRPGISRFRRVRQYHIPVFIGVVEDEQGFYKVVLDSFRERYSKGG